MPKATTKTRGTPVSMRVLTDAPDREEVFSAWLLNQATELRTRKPGGIDWQHVAEELEEVAARIRHALLSDLEIVLIHLLKAAVRNQRQRVARAVAQLETTRRRASRSSH